MTKHLNISPTPWSATEMGMIGWVMDAEGKYILECVHRDEEGRYEKDPAIQQNNLRLAANAPQMLEALKDIIHADDEGMGLKAVELRIEIARDLIKQIEGE